MKERPILFSAPMVRALLNGSKTQTRRVVKPKTAETLEWFGGKADADDDRTLDELLGQRTEKKGLRVWCFDYPEEGSEVIHCPYGQPGDRLWVREAWRTVAEADATPPRDLNEAHRLWREADAPHQPGFGKYRPPMFMPRWASRITLEITEVRVERLQDISEADAIAEGVYSNPDCCGMWTGDGDTHTSKADGPVRAYKILWESINGPGSWDANPWVWVIEFKRVEGAKP